MELSSPRFKALAVSTGLCLWFFILTSTPEQCYNMLKKTDMDYVVMGNYVVARGD